MSVFQFFEQCGGVSLLPEICRSEYMSYVVLMPLGFPFTMERRLREMPKGNKVVETKNLRNTGTEGMEIIKSIFGEQLEQDSS